MFIFIEHHINCLVDLFLVLPILSNGIEQLLRNWDPWNDLLRVSLAQKSPLQPFTELLLKQLQKKAKIPDFILITSINVDRIWNSSGDQCFLGIIRYAFQLLST